MIPWNHQSRGVAEALEAIRKGHNKLLVTSPTGGGKTWMEQAIASDFLEREEPGIIYTNRKLLLDQTSRVFAGAGFGHGTRAAGTVPTLEALLQISSIQTERSRVLNRQSWEMHEAKIVLIDEAHCQTGASVRKLIDRHIQEHGAVIVGFTATPIGLGDMYDRLIVAGTNSELRECGALVPCLHYAPDEPDMRILKGVKGHVEGEDFSEPQLKKLMMTPTIFGRVWDHWKKLNPEQRPTILFAPSVADSLWFAEQFHANGVSAAHIDGQEVWINGDRQPTSREIRAQVLEGSRDGRIRVLCNRFVLREGIDAPWLCHGIFATVFGSLQSMLQAGGRLLRAYPGIDEVVLQDHGGNWWRHGSLNADREWKLEYTGTMIAGLRADRLRGKRCWKCKAQLKPPWPLCPECGALNEVEPWRCPQCQRVIQAPRCSCGWSAQGARPGRRVVEIDGTLKQMAGDIFRPRRLTQRNDAANIWERMYYRARSKKWDATFRQAEAMFAQENNWGWPPRNLPLMPRNEMDWFLRVSEVPQERLIQKGENT